MLVTCWSVKGGSGTTVVAASLAVVLAQGPSPLLHPGAARSGHPTVLVDLDGDVPGALGAAEPSGPGIAQWLDSDAPAESLEHLAHEVAPQLLVVPRGSGPLLSPDHPRWAELARHLAMRPGMAVVDAGSRGAPPSPLHDAGTSVLVVRPCFLALRRLSRLGIRPDQAVLIDEPGRALRRADIESVIGVRVSAHLDLDPAIARAVDSGLLAARLPAPLRHGLARVA